MKRYSVKNLKKRVNLKDTKGGVEEICNGYISGWIFNKNNKLTEVRLLNGEKVLASTKINIFRSDVNEKYEIDYKTGFLLRLNINTQLIDKHLNISLIAMNSAGSFNQELFLLNDPYLTTTRIKNILRSPILGMDGQIDDLTESGELLGWATSYNKKNTSIIWLHNFKNESNPQKIECNLQRDDLNKIGIFNNCGFKISTENTYDQLKNIFLSFDTEGKYKIKFNEIVLKKIQLLKENKNTSEVSNIRNIKELKELEGINITLNKLESLIENIEVNIEEYEKKNSLLKKFWSYLIKIKKNIKKQKKI